jgi:threonine dehydrogenase-like Zn-dependent dehydrogenase
VTTVWPSEAQVARLLAPRRLELQAQPLPTPGPDAVACETLVSAISPGTELAAYAGLPPLREGPAYPRLQGYCNVARVVKVGREVQGLQPGQRVLSFQSHRSHFVIGADEVLRVVPPGLPSEAAATTYLFHLGYNALVRADARAGSRVLVLGLGALGLATVAVACLAGAEVRAVTAHEPTGRRAARLGCAQVLPRDRAAAECAAWADVVVTTSSTWADWALALGSAAQRGTIAVLGFPGRGEPPPSINPLDSRHFYDRQLRIEAVGHSPERPDGRGFTRFNERDNLAFLLARIADGRLGWQELVSGTYPGADLGRAYEDLLARRGDPVTYVLRWHPD